MHLGSLLLRPLSSPHGTCHLFRTVAARSCCGGRLSTTAISPNSDNVEADPAVDSLHSALTSGKRWALAKSITLVESTHKIKKEQAGRLLARVEADLRSRSPGYSFRIGLSGPPGAGKSTFIEAFGKSLTAKGHKVAVLAVDPSSGTTGGSLLADKTRMPELTRDHNAYIRPSPSMGHLGGVTRTTNESVLLCEGAGYDVVIVETVGVGQSEYLVADMVDMFCLLLPPAGGDELQGIKRGIVEQSDLIVINKCDGDLVSAARRIKGEYTSALKYMRRRTPHWKPRVKMVSSLTGDGLPEVWDTMAEFKAAAEEAGELEGKRARQRKRWMWSYVNHRLLQIFMDHPSIKGRTSELEAEVMSFRTSPGGAADRLIRTFLSEWEDRENDDEES